ncbi:MAG: hypothetical protein HKL96_08240 [Phycisphaerales bacterium]|nr:hypothetical protein [Phycisphaerales bacterium]
MNSLNRSRRKFLELSATAATATGLAGHSQAAIADATAQMVPGRLISSEPATWLKACNVIWTSPSTDAAGSMPMGNGEAGINFWATKKGELHFYFCRSDSFSEIGRILKVGALKVTLTPNLFKPGLPFRQELDLHTGVCTITAGPQDAPCTLQIFVDAEHPVVHVTGHSHIPMQVTATVTSWRQRAHTIKAGEDWSAWAMKGAPFALVESADLFPPAGAGEAIWYHRNESSCVPDTLKLQSLERFAHLIDDPLLHRTFGGHVAGEGFVAGDKGQIKTAGKVKQFSLRVATPCVQATTAAIWLNEAQRLLRASADATTALQRTSAWWKSFWQRSWICVPGNLAVTQGINRQRYMQACGGRGAFPIKFNGGQFTVEPKAMGRPWNADWRAWGNCHWWQNVRHMYHPMPALGDFEMMAPLFNMYDAARPVCTARAGLYFNARGCYFPETMTVWGTYANADYGWNRKGHPPSFVACGYWKHAWNQGPELVNLMLDYWHYTRDENFLAGRLLPMAVDVLEYFDSRFKRDAHGRMILNPTQAVETYWYGVINDAPSSSGLVAITERLCALPKHLVPTKLQAYFRRMRQAAPLVPTQEATCQGKTVRKLAPAEQYINKTHNCENPELYPVWPFRLYRPGKPDYDQAVWAYKLRRNHLYVGWGYDANCAAILGMADEAAKILKIKCANSNGRYRWPATWGPNFDWLPDQNHGGNLLETATSMLLQFDGDKILLLPAWPRHWDAIFKLHAPDKTVVECELRSGTVTRLDVTPASRRKDVVLAGDFKMA